MKVCTAVCRAIAVSVVHEVFHHRRTSKSSKKAFTVIATTLTHHLRFLPLYISCWCCALVTLTTMPAAANVPATRYRAGTGTGSASYFVRWVRRHKVQCNGYVHARAVVMRAYRQNKVVLLNRLAQFRTCEGATRAALSQNISRRCENAARAAYAQKICRRSEATTNVENYKEVT